MDYMLENIHALLMDGFIPAELQEFIDFDPVFRAARDYVPTPPSKVQLVTAIIEYANQEAEFPRLLKWAKENAPEVYEDHRPYNLTDAKDIFDAGATIILSEIFTPETRPISQDREDNVVWKMASLKSELYAISQTVAYEAVQQIPSDESEPLQLLIPLLFFLRWKRGHQSGLKHIFGLNERKILADFPLVEVNPPCLVEQGFLSAELSNNQQILIKLDNHPAIIVTPTDPTDIPAIIKSVNIFGKLGQNNDDESLQELIGKISIYPRVADADELTLMLIQNRQVLTPLLARLGIPTSDWLLSEEEEQAIIGKGLLRNTPARKSGDTAKSLNMTDGWDDIETIPFHLQGKLCEPGRRQQASMDMLMQQLMNSLPEETRRRLQELYEGNNPEE